MVVHLPTNKHLNLPPHVPNLSRVDQITALGITFDNTLSGGPHVNLITAKADASFYAQKTLKSHGLSGPALWDVTRATLLALIIMQALHGEDLLAPMKQINCKPF